MFPSPGELLWITSGSTSRKQYPFGGHLLGVRVAFQGFGSCLDSGRDSLPTLFDSSHNKRIPRGGSPGDTP